MSDYGVACTTGAVEGRTGTLETAAATAPATKTPLPLAQLSPVRSPDWFVLDLPRPPSVNQFRWKLGNASPDVIKWIEQADRYVMARRPRPHLEGSFETEITWNIAEFGKFDCDNPVKPLMDYLQRVRIIENDRWCQRLVIGWDKIELGCQVAVRPWVAT